VGGRGLAQDFIPLRKRISFFQRACAFILTVMTNPAKASIQVKRVYEPASAADGVRVLVDGLWPRGLSKGAAAVDLWLKDIGPSRALRRWFNRDPSRWAEFRKRYAAELDSLGARSPAVAALAGAVRRGKVTLLFGARDRRHNTAVALYEYLTGRYLSV
jgi:uncharacterized protein YeaO (DUF488 family)